ncbi:hypothetical protein [Microbaculum marinisediminis]|uniref:Uncharacterized protein n=1 Tax=Microbaculum marinisediminis TaxID=2931392 RepID=A0AAW5QRG0_9HYPH|nr:hypothetical protein [Microbaculum sp. A6E488]MCT8970560.1 hypothetical protein [Microbaculum sp. A6E488]
MRYSIDTVAGDTVIADLALVDDTTGEPADLTSLDQARWWAAPAPTTPIDLVPLKKVLGGGLVVLGAATDGILRLTLDAGETSGLAGIYYHEVEVVFADGTLRTAVYDPIRIRPGLVRD